MAIISYRNTGDYKLHFQNPIKQYIFSFWYIIFIYSFGLDRRIRGKTTESVCGYSKSMIKIHEFDHTTKGWLT